VRWWQKSPGSCSSLLVCLSLALLSLPTGKSASSTAVSTNTISSLPYPAGGLHPGPSWFCASSLRLIQRVAIHQKYVEPPVVVTIKILTPLPVVWINYFFDSTPPFPLSMRSPAGCATSMPPGYVRTAWPRVLAEYPLLQSRWGKVRGRHFGLGSSGAVDRIEIRWPKGNSESFRGGSVDRFVALIEGRSGTPHGL
jgi:hypothetical protein